MAGFAKAGWTVNTLRRTYAQSFGIHPSAFSTKVPGRSVWFPIPGMYGGFHITLRQDYLESSSWCRVAGGSGQLQVITHEGVVLAD